MTKPAPDSFKEFPGNNAFINRLLDKLERHPKRIVFPEADDPRVLRAAEALVRHKAVLPILLGNRDAIMEMAEKEAVSLKFVHIIEPEKATDFELFCERFEKTERYRKLKVTDAASVISKPHYFAAMMLQYGQVDGLVGGNKVLPAALFRPLFHLIKPLPHMEKAAACSILTGDMFENCGGDCALFLADTGIIPNPSVEDLAAIAVETGKLCRHLCGKTPRIAMLSYSTHGSADSASPKKMQAAAALGRQRAHQEVVEMTIDGEIQVDAALLPEVAARKAHDSPLQGKADVLIFPDLNSGNISLKFLQCVAGAHTFGHFMLGLSRPAAQVSRVASPQTILGTAAVVATQAIKYHEIYPNEFEL